MAHALIHILPYEIAMIVKTPTDDDIMINLSYSI